MSGHKLSPRSDINTVIAHHILPIETRFYRPTIQHDRATLLPDLSVAATFEILDSGVLCSLILLGEGAIYCTSKHKKYIFQCDFAQGTPVITLQYNSSSKYVGSMYNSVYLFSSVTCFYNGSQKQRNGK